MTIVKSCNAVDCGKQIRWHSVPGKSGVGYWVDDDSNDRHLCPSFVDPRSSTKTEVTHLQTNDTILRRMDKIENMLTEIKLKLESVIP